MAMSDDNSRLATVGQDGTLFLFSFSSTADFEPICFMKVGQRLPGKSWLRGVE